jgi:hypothetical protein
MKCCIIVWLLSKIALNNYFDNRVKTTLSTPLKALINVATTGNFVAMHLFLRHLRSGKEENGAFS